MQSNEFDVVIIGSGMGGLACGYILAKEGMKVCVLEKNQQFGGCVQSFKFDGVVFDTGVHYVGGLDEGQNLHKYFSYFDIIDKLKIKRLDNDGAEHISFSNSPKEYKFAMGHQNFIDTLAEDFPKEKQAIANFVKKMKEVCAEHSLYTLKHPKYTPSTDFKNFEISIAKYLDENFKDEKIKKVLAGNNLLYAGQKNMSSIYEHALITNSYIESAYRFVDGAGQIASAMVRNIRKLGGVVKRNSQVNKIVVNDKNLAEYVLLDNNEKLYAKNFISNVHPTITLKMLEGIHLKKSYINRLNNIPNSGSAFALHIVLEDNKVEYKNYNLYHFNNNNVWTGSDYKPADWPEAYMAFTPISSKSDKWADSIIMIANMNYEEVKQWENTENIAGKEADRGADYHYFKEQKAQKMLEGLYKKWPEVRGNVKSYNVSTPLTYRDYLYSPEGSIYGFQKDYNNPFLSYLTSRTKVPNLFFTGQNVNMHGVLGVTISAFVTCGELLGIEYLYNKVKF